MVANAAQDDSTPREVTQADYYFGYGVGPSNAPALEAVKTWIVDGERRFDTFTIAEYGMFEDAAQEEQELTEMLEIWGVQSALNLAEKMAVASGYLNPERTDGRVFRAEDAPADPFTTVRERELAAPEMEAERKTLNGWFSGWEDEARRERAVNAPLEGAAWFEATFAHSDRELLQPLDATVNYAVVMGDIDPWTRELAVEKYWRAPGGYLGVDSQTVDTFDPEDEALRRSVDSTQQALLDVHRERGLEAMMHEAELHAMETGWLNGDRVDGRLFRDGPPDRFETLAQQLADEPNPYWSVDDGGPESLLALEVQESQTWRLDRRDVIDPDGERLGEALFCTVLPDADVPDFDTPLAARTLEMAHFETTQAADRFVEAFSGYLVPGVLDGPELAEEVAKLEGLPGKWIDVESREKHEPEMPLMRERADWHPYDPTRERESYSVVDVSDWETESDSPSETSAELDFDF